MRLAHFDAICIKQMISVENLSKHYRVHKRDPGLKAALRSIFRRTHSEVKAVENISFEITRGERVGFLGPNGAGKTTTLKILSGLLYPTHGRVRVDGHLPQQREDDYLKKIMLVMGQKQQLLWDLPPSETLEMNRAIYGVSRADFNQTLKELTDLLELGELLGKPTRQLSLGERMKCELAAALVHRPKILFLDEPTIGLDVAMQVTMRDFIKQYNQRHGATLMLTSHYMDDVAALCPRVLVIDKGKISFDGSLESLIHRFRPEKRIVLKFNREVASEDLTSLGTLISLDSTQAVLHVPPERVSETVTRALAQLPVKDLTVENPPLEEVLSELFSRTRSDREAAMP